MEVKLVPGIYKVCVGNQKSKAIHLDQKDIDYLLSLRERVGKHGPPKTCFAEGAIILELVEADEGEKTS